VFLMESFWKENKRWKVFGRKTNDGKFLGGKQTMEKILMEFFVWKEFWWKFLHGKGFEWNFFAERNQK